MTNIFLEYSDEILSKAFTILFDDFHKSWNDKTKATEMRSIFNGLTSPCCYFENWVKCIEYLNNVNKIKIEPLELYVVQNKEGNFFRAKGYSGSGESWVDNIKKAKIYGKIGPARSIVTFWSNSYPKHGIPDILKLNVEYAISLDEEERVKKVIQKQQKQEAEKNKRRAQKDLEDAKINLERAKQEVNRLIRNMK